MSMPTKVALIYGVGLCLSSLFISQRIYTKFKILGSFTIEDWLLIAAFAFSIGTQAIGLHLFTDHVAGSHLDEVSQSQRREFAVAMIVAPIVYTPATCLAKLSLLFFYLKLTPQVWFLRTAKVLMLIIVGYTLGITLSNIFACRPIQAAWDRSIVDKQCINTNALYIATAILNTITDVTMLIIPIPVIMPLQMSRRQKMEVVGIFVLGSLTFVTSIIRLVYLIPMVSNPIDATWKATWPVLYLGIEANLQIICASAPTLRKFLQTTLPRFFESVRGSTTRRTESMGLRTFGQAAATPIKQRRPSRADEMEATLIRAGDSRNKQFSHCSRMESQTIRFDRDPDLIIMGSSSDCGSDNGTIQPPPPVHARRPG